MDRIRQRFGVVKKSKDKYSSRQLVDVAIGDVHAASRLWLDDVEEILAGERRGILDPYQGTVDGVRYEGQDPNDFFIASLGNGNAYVILTSAHAYGVQDDLRVPHMVVDGHDLQEGKIMLSRMGPDDDFRDSGAELVIKYPVIMRIKELARENITLPEDLPEEDISWEEDNFDEYEEY